MFLRRLNVIYKLDQHHYIVRKLAWNTEAERPVGQVESKEDDGEDNSAVLVWGKIHNIRNHFGIFLSFNEIALGTLHFSV